MAEVDECRSLNRFLVIERQDMKRRIEVIMAKVSSSSCSSFIKDKISEVKNCIKLLEKVDKNILSNIIKFESLDEFYISERDAAYDYKIDIEEKIAIVAENLTKSSTPSPTSKVSVLPITNPSEGAISNNSDRPASSLSLFRGVKKPPVQIGRFEGDKEDILASSRFFSKFRALIDSNSMYSDEEKFIHLINNLGTTAYEMVKHLSPEGSNYNVALNILKTEYLDKDFIIEKIIIRLLEIPPPPEDDLTALKQFLNEVKALVYELKSYNIDLLMPETAGFHMISTTIVYKLPPKFSNALIDKVQSNYPNILDLFDNSSTLLKRLELTLRNQHQPEHNDFNSRRNKFDRNSNSNSLSKNTNNGYEYKKLANYDGGHNEGYGRDKFSHFSHPKKTSQKSTKSHFPSKNKAPNLPFPCKFCSAASHTMNKCPAYPDIESRLERCDQLNICKFCSSTKHDTDKCPGNHDNFLDYACLYCNLHTHISALCQKGHSHKSSSQIQGIPD
ncbi:UNVERIFIED_CONTAM: hypothetical protein RMT77_003611 [Armadillidium vulgare]